MAKGRGSKKGNLTSAYLYVILLHILELIYSIMQRDLSIISGIISILAIILLIAGFISTLRLTINSGYIGVLAGGLLTMMFIVGNLFDGIIGIILIFYSLDFISKYNQDENSN